MSWGRVLLCEMGVLFLQGGTAPVRFYLLPLHEMGLYELSREDTGMFKGRVTAVPKATAASPAGLRK